MHTLILSASSVRRAALAGAFLGLLPFVPQPEAHAQGPAFQSPGLPKRSTTGQTTRFSNEFNPAFGFVIDTIVDWLDRDDGAGETDDGFDAKVRLLEFNAAGYLDPNAWAYIVFVSDELEAPEIEEAAVELTGFAERTSLKVGQFFVDFGKQMQQHVEELRTVERPLALRTLLGDELGGAGAQLDWWTPLGDSTPLRASLGVFGTLVGGHEHGEEEEEGIVAEAPELKALDELSFTARITALTELSPAQNLQFGVSGRFIPEFTFEDEESGVESSGLSNTVFGADLTWGWADSTGNRNATAGIEWLTLTGDVAAQVDDPLNPTELIVSDDDASGFYVFADYGFNPRNNVGLQYSAVELPGADRADASEIEAYWTHHFTEYRRLRLGVSQLDVDGGAEDLRVYLQFTAYLGSHSHGLNW